VEPPIDKPAELVDDADPGPIRGLFRSLAKLLATAIGIAQTRLELLSTELQEEVHRAAEILVWTIVALLAALMLIAVTAALVLRAKIRSRPRLFDATLTELAKDRASLMQRRS
jgi:uncharacterized membrane protein YqjE